MRFAALRAFVSAATGIAVSSFGLVPWWGGLILVALGLAAAWPTRGWSLYACLAGATFAYSSSRGNPVPDTKVYECHSFRGVVIQEPPDDSVSRAVIQIEHPVSCKVVLWLNGHSPIRYGDLVLVRGQARKFDHPRNPGVFDLDSYMRSKGIVGELSAEARNVTILSHGRGCPVVRCLVEPMRRYVLTAARHLLPNQEAGLLVGLLLGERQGIPLPTRSAFADSGTMHVLAVSGLHVGIVVYAIWLLLSVARIRGWWRFGLTAVLIAAYVLLTGARASAMRAGIMSLAVLLSFPTQRKIDPLSSLAVAGIIILLLAPSSLSDIGFQLSFAAAASIVLTHSAFDPVASRIQSGLIRNLVFWPFVVSLAASLGTGPLLLLHFHRVQLLSALFSPVIILPVSVAIPLGMLVLTLFPLSNVLAGFFAETLHLVLSAVLKLVSFFGTQQWTILEPGPVPWLAVSLVYGLMLLAVNWRQNWARTGLRVGIALGLNLLMWRGAFVNPQTRATFLEPVRGDCLMLEDTLGRLVLIDAGVSKTGVLRDYLRYRGIHRIDLAVVTHPDNDHYGGLLDIDDRCRIHRLVVPTLSGGEEYQRLLARFAARGTELVVAGKGTKVRGLGFNLEFIWPEPQAQTLYRDNLLPSNDVSLVCRYEHAGFRMLLTGDFEKPDLIADQDIHAALLKSPHHGSIKGNPPSLYDKVRPDYVVVMGRYPTPAELETRLAWLGERYVNTRQRGAWELVFRDGRPSTHYLVHATGN